MKLKTLILIFSMLISFSSIAQTPKDLNAKGEEYYYAGNYTKAVKYFRQAAEQGYAAAQSNLGGMYYLGYGVQKNYTEGVKWLRKAANQGYSEAQISLGFCYYNGDGVPRSYTEAVKWFRKAAKQGNTKAINILEALEEK